MLKANAIKLFLLLHFYHPDNNGIVYNLEACELASVIGCNVRTVWNNLRYLKNIHKSHIQRMSMGLLMLSSMIMKIITFLPIKVGEVFLSCQRSC